MSNLELTATEVQELKPYEESIDSLKAEVEKNIPGWTNEKAFREFAKKIGDADDSTKTMLREVPNGERPAFILKAARLMKQNKGLSLQKAVRCIKHKKDSSYINLKTLEDKEHFDEHDILDLFNKTIDEGKDPFSGIKTDMVFSNVKINETIKDDGGILYFDKLPKNIQDEILRGVEIKYRDLLYNRILDSLQKNPGILPESLFDNEEFLKFYVGFFNALHHGETPLNYESLSQKDKKRLRNDFKAELSILDLKVYGVNATILREKEERDRLIREENQRRIEEWMKKNESINNSISGEYSIENHNTTVSGFKYYDPQSASGAEIAAHANLGEKLDGYNLDMKEPEHKDEREKETIFRESWKNFIQNNDKIKSLVTQEQMRVFFDIDNNTINISKLDDFMKKNPIIKSLPQNEKDGIKKALLSFPYYFDNTENDFSNDSSKAKSKINETVRTYAIGNVIDNVRDTFNTLNKNQGGKPKGLQLNNGDPVKKDGDDIVISGSFDDSNVEVHYNLRTGKLYMNSFLQKMENEEKFIIGGNTLVEIGQIKTFDNLLNDCYKFPTSPSEKNKNGVLGNKKDLGENQGFHDDEHKDISSNGDVGIPKRTTTYKEDDFRKKEGIYEKLFNSQIELINKAIEGETKKQSYRNSIITKFMRTFNIINDNQELNNIEVKNGSNLYDFLRIIKQSDSNELESFQTFMEELMESASLKWGKNNINGHGDNDTFDENNKNEYCMMVRDHAENFSKNPLVYSGKLNFDSDSQLRFIDMIMENVTEQEKPNLRLDLSKMKEFIGHLKNDNKKLSTDDKKLSADN